MICSNPYDAVDISAIQITPAGENRGLRVFQVHTRNHKPFDACVFRQHLLDFLMDHMEDEWHFGNDDTYAEFHEDDIALALSHKDAARFERYGWLI